MPVFSVLSAAAAVARQQAGRLPPANGGIFHQLLKTSFGRAWVFLYLRSFNFQTVLWMQAILPI
jgi:hypothetical protein